MEQTDTLIRRHNNGITNDPCALCGARCDPDGRDYFIGESWSLVCQACVDEHVGPIVDRIEMEHTEMQGYCQVCGPLGDVPINVCR